MTLPTAEEQLKTHLGSQYNAWDWQPALDTVMNAEGDINLLNCTQSDSYFIVN
jgi:hypothetical protein